MTRPRLRVYDGALHGQDYSTLKVNDSPINRNRSISFIFIFDLSLRPNVLKMGLSMRMTLLVPSTMKSGDGLRISVMIPVCLMRAHQDSMLFK